MSKLDVVRAWKDEDYRMSLSEAERRMLPCNPAGLIEISDRDLGAVGGGTGIANDVRSAVCSSLFDACQSAWGGVCTGCIVPCAQSAGPYGPYGPILCPFLPGDYL